MCQNAHMDRSRFGYGEVLTADTASPDTNDDKLNRAFDRVEASANERQVDVHPSGVVSGLAVVENSTPNLTVKVNAGVAYDQTGNRIEIPSQQSLDPLTDYQGNAIALPTLGNERYVSVFLKFKRLDQEATQDNNSVPYYESELEHFEIRVRAGSSAATGTATPPALQGAEILLADIKLTPGMTTITNGEIELQSRRQDAWKLTPTTTSPKTIRVGTSKEAATLLLGWLNDLLTGTLTLDTNGVTHTNGAETFAGAQSPPPNGSLQTWLRTLVAYLGSSSGGNGVGASRIGMSAPGNWADGNSAGSAGQLSTIITGFVTALAASTGLAKIGGAAVSQSPTSLSAGTGQAMLEALLTAVNARARKASAETISGAWAVDDLTWSSGNWPKVTSRTAVRERPLNIAACSVDSGANDASVKRSDITVSVGLNTYYVDMVESVISNASGRWLLMRLEELPDGNVLASVALETKINTSDGSVVAAAKYEVVRYKVGTSGITAASLMSGGPANDDHTSGNMSSIRTQTLTCDQNSTIDTTQFRYGIWVQLPYNGDAQLRVYSLRPSITLTTLRPS